MRHLILACLLSAVFVSSTAADAFWVGGKYAVEHENDPTPGVSVGYDLGSGGFAFVFRGEEKTTIAAYVYSTALDSTIAPVVRIESDFEPHSRSGCFCSPKRRSMGKSAVRCG